MTRRTTRTAGLFLTGLVALGAGCHARIEAQLSVNNAPFQPTGCRSGQAYGFAGVELADASGARLRLATTPSGQAQGYWFPAGSDQGTDLGLCGTMAFGIQNSTINNVHNVEGNATVACTNSTVAVMGHVTFANCH